MAEPHCLCLWMHTVWLGRVSPHWCPLSTWLAKAPLIRCMGGECWQGTSKTDVRDRSVQYHVTEQVIITTFILNETKVCL